MKRLVCIGAILGLTGVVCSRLISAAKPIVAAKSLQNVSQEPLEFLKLYEVPTEIQDTLPSGGTTIQIGAARFAPHGAMLLFHFYMTKAKVQPYYPAKQSIHSSVHNADTVFLDISSPTGNILGKQWQLLNTVRLGLLDEPNAPKSVYYTGFKGIQYFPIKFLWLRPNQKQGPVLMLHNRTFSKHWLMFPFPQGFAGTTKMIICGESDAGDTLSFAVDNRGYMMLSYLFYEHVGGKSGSDNYVTVEWHWDGNGFNTRQQFGKFHNW
jgi:hypothetical protein